jgi:hypothetical protein
VEVGERFSLAVPDRGAASGDSWSAVVTGLSTHGRRTEPGRTYFTYTAERAGTTTVTLSNAGGTGELTWTVTAR